MKRSKTSFECHQQKVKIAAAGDDKVRLEDEHRGEPPEKHPNKGTSA